MTGKFGEKIKEILDSTSIAIDIRDTDDPTGEVTTLNVPLGIDVTLLQKFQLCGSRLVRQVRGLRSLQSASKPFPLGIPALNSGGNSGAAAWIAAMMLFHRSPIAFIGVDMGYPDGTPIEQTQYYDRIIQAAGGDNSKLEGAYPRYYHPVFKSWAYVDFIFNHYRLALIELQQATKLWYRLYGGTYNCSEQGTLFGEGINCCTFKEFLERYKK